MVRTAYTGVVIGIEGNIITCEVDTLNSQLPSFSIVGLPDKSIQEARERIVSAVKNSGFIWPRKKIIVNLAPADIQKVGTHLDLAIAVAILSSSLELDFNYNEFLFIGELALDGSLRTGVGILSIALAARNHGIKNIIVPSLNSQEASMVKDLNVFAVGHLNEVIRFIKDNTVLSRTEFDDMSFRNTEYEFNFDHIIGQQTLKRASIIAVAGGHNILFTGSPGSGKTMISRALPSIMPKLEFEESLELTKIYSVANRLEKNQPLIIKRPFRAPHHTASSIAIIGGGKIPKPGEISLAHRGILFLDEFPEFSTYTLEALRQPLEDKNITISRVGGSLTFPSSFMLVAAMNPCKCGWFGDLDRECICTPHAIEKYRSKISGPIMDRIDLQIPVQRVKLDDLSKSDRIPERTYMTIQADVQKCRDIQKERYKDFHVYCNSEVPQKYLESIMKLETDAKKFLLNAANKLNLSARSFFRIIRVSRTIADLELSQLIDKKHVAEALQYRLTER